jgi:FKBP-type peptidyl-prolyl cis-trans isomerase FkpA/FKBP-type peptidyl-prolyl cis-trans isomerase FklB
MRHLPTAVALGLVAAGIAGCGGKADQEAKTAAAAATGPQTEEEKTLYALGQAVARNIQPFELTEAELKQVSAGFNDGALKKNSEFDIQSYFPKIQELQQARITKAAEGEKKAGEEFLAKAAKEQGAQQTPSGLVYSQVKAGEGESPKSTDTVKVHYHGTLMNGSVFDSSVQRNEPATFPLNGVIPCWTEGVQMMKVGGKAKLICPASIAYGDRGAPPDIKPGATLVFEVELLGIEKPQ